MGMILAVKRSYRHFLPGPFLSPGKFVRRWHLPLFFYAVGLFTGMYVHPSEPERVTYYALATMGALLLLKWWSKASAKPPEVE
jgi:hypothetical protein